MDVSQLRSIFLLSNRDLTIKTNAAAEQDNTIELEANKPFAWQGDDGTLRDTEGTAITVDVTALYITNADEDNTADLDIFTLIDPTV